MKQKTKADICLLLITVVWGASFTLMKEGIKDIPPYTFLSIRYIIGCLLLVVLFSKNLRKINLESIKYGTIIGITLSGGAIFQILGLKYTSASKSGFITGLCVVFVPIIVALLLKKLPSKNAIAGILLSLLGLSLLTLNNYKGVSIGDILTLIGSIFFAFQIIFVDRYTAKYDSIVLTVIEMAVISIISLFFSIFVEGFKVTITPYSVFAILFTAILCSALGYLVQMEMQKYTTPTHAAIIFLGEPVFAAIIAAVFLREVMTLKMIFGCFFILIGMIISESSFL